MTRDDTRAAAERRAILLARIEHATQRGWDSDRQLMREVRAELQTLHEVLDIAGQTMDAVEEWLGQASTREAAVDSLYRLRRALQRVGINTGPRTDNLDWRGSILDELWQAGFFRSHARDAFVLDPQKRVHGNADGPTLAEVAAFASGRST